MEYRHLGSSGLMVSAISYGNWITHGSQIEVDQAKSCVKAALDLGITTFDTADVYANTKAEAILGESLKGIPRESIEIFTKVYWPTGAGMNNRGLSRKHIFESVHSSLKRLNTDYIDLYQAHRYDYETPLEETLSAFDDLIRQGKVLYIGVSEWKASEIESAVNIANQYRFNPIISNQPQYSILWRVIEAQVVPTCEKYGIGQIVWSPLAQGVLTGKYLPGQPYPQGSRASDPTGSNFISRWLNDKILTKVQELKNVALEAGVSLAQLSLAWVLSHKFVSSAIVGATRPEQLQENVKSIEVRITPDLLAEIDKILGDVIISDPSLTVSPEKRP
jgi:voltage-dependent potassium channel beta subunit